MQSLFLCTESLVFERCLVKSVITKPLIIAMQISLLLRSAMAIAVAMPMMLSAQNRTFVVDGVNYRETSENTVQIEKPAEGEYTGAFTFVPTVAHEGKTYDVELRGSALQYAEISEMTLADGWQGRSVQNYSLRYTKNLERINLKCGIVPAESPDYSINFSLGNNPGCVWASVSKGTDKCSLHLDKFNVFDSKGNRLTPFLMVEDDTHDRIYPDENMTFELGPNFRTKDDRYCVVLELASYIVVALYVEVDGNLVCLRIEPAPGQGSPVEDVDGFKVSSWGDEAIIAPQDPATVSGDVVIPEYVEIEGRQVPVKAISADAFKGCPIKTLTLPETITKIFDSTGTLGLDGSTTLESVDLSAIKSGSVSLNYMNCPNLTEVILPKSQQRLYSRFHNCASLSMVTFPEDLESISGGAFDNCPALTEIALPSTVKQIGYEAFRGCALTQVAIPEGCTVSCPFVLASDVVSRSTQLYSVDVIEATDDIVKMKVNSNITSTDGTPLPLCAVPAYGNLKTVAIIQPDADGVFTILRRYTDVDATHTLNTVFFSYNAEAGNYMAGPQIDAGVNSQSFFRADVSSLSGMATVKAADNNAQADYFDLQGRPVIRDNAVPGIYIRRQGGKASKIIIR